ncbi:hypothetical protein ACFMPD_16785 [Sedimentitalea sp. HM32M-2]|uniref:hypothetical protein n=1 Tax=Sedimentitalea sp. HM32M-2 TaxID=3351566 RepID=UPI0036370E52
MAGSDDDDDVGIRGKVELTTNWWKQAWPIDKKPANDAKLTKALKDLKKAKVGKSAGDLIDALNDVDTALDAVMGDTGKIPKKNPLKKKAIKNDLKKAKTIVAQDLKALEKHGSKERVIYKKDFGAAMNQSVSDIRLGVSSCPVELKLLEVLALEMEAKGGLAMLNNALNDEFDGAVKKCDKDLRAIVKRAGGLMDADSMSDVIDSVTTHAQDLQEEMRDVPVVVMRKMRIHAAVAKAYKKDKAVKITKGAVGVGLGVAGAALPGTLPFALVALARSIASLAKEIVTVLMDLDTKIKLFVKQLSALAAIYKKHRGAREIALSSLNSVLGVDVAPTLNKAKADLKEIEKCVAVFYHRANKMIKKVYEALDKSNELTKRFEKSASDVKAFMASNKNRKIRKAMDDLDSILNKTHDLMRQAVDAEKKVPQLRKGLKDLGDNSGKVDKANVIIGQIINLAIALGGVTDAAAVGQAIESVAVAGVGLWMDSAEAGKELASL